MPDKVERRYPILQGQSKEAYAAQRNHTPWPITVPWSLVEGHEWQAQVNHSQTLDRLAQRGGLSPAELWCVVHGKDLLMLLHGEITETAAVEWLKSVEGVRWYPERLNPEEGKGK